VLQALGLDGLSETAVAVPGVDGAVVSIRPDALPQLTMALKLTPAQRRWKKKQRKMQESGGVTPQEESGASGSRGGIDGGGGRRPDPNSKNSKKRKRAKVYPAS
jgi:hypothetical protein